MRISPNKKIKLKNSLLSWFTAFVYIGALLLFAGAFILSKNPEQLFGKILIGLGIVLTIGRLIVNIIYKIVDNTMPDSSIDDEKHRTPVVFAQEDDFAKKNAVIIAHILPKVKGMDIFCYDGQYRLLTSFAKLLPSISSVVRSDQMKKLEAGKPDPSHIIGELILLTEKAIGRTEFEYLIHRWKQIDLDTLTDAYILVDSYLNAISGPKPAGLSSAKNALVSVIYPKVNNL